MVSQWSVVSVAYTDNEIVESQDTAMELLAVQRERLGKPPLTATDNS